MILREPRAERNIPMSQLERGRTQIRISTGLPEDQQPPGRARRSARRPRAAPKASRRCSTAWSTGDVTGSPRSSTREVAGDPASYRPIFTNRNSDWARGFMRGSRGPAPSSSRSAPAISPAATASRHYSRARPSPLSACLMSRPASAAEAPRFASQAIAARLPPPRERRHLNRRRWVSGGRFRSRRWLSLRLSRRGPRDRAPQWSRRARCRTAYPAFWVVRDEDIDRSLSVSRHLPHAGTGRPWFQRRGAERLLFHASSELGSWRRSCPMLTSGPHRACWSAGLLCRGIRSGAARPTPVLAGRKKRAIGTVPLSCKNAAAGACRAADRLSVKQTFHLLVRGRFLAKDRLKRWKGLIEGRCNGALTAAARARNNLKSGQITRRFEWQMRRLDGIPEDFAVSSSCAADFGTSWSGPA